MNNLVIMKDQQAVTDSLKVADAFNKKHKNVMQSIDNKIHSAENPAQFKKMFVEATYQDASGKSNRMYYMNRDGFTFIAMGFTGRKADDFKLKYIQAFNEMEKQIHLKAEYSGQNQYGSWINSDIPEWFYTKQGTELIDMYKFIARKNHEK